MRQAVTFTMIATVLLCLPHAGGAARITIEPGNIVSLTPPAESEEAARYLAAIELPSALSGATVDYAELKLGIRASVGQGSESDGGLHRRRADVRLREFPVRGRCGAI